MKRVGIYNKHDLPPNQQEINILKECPHCNRWVDWSKSPKPEFQRKGTGNSWLLTCPYCKAKVEKKSNMLMLRKKGKKIVKSKRKKDCGCDT
jgi:endogenous inhibitor of DNA gyrase (YacG/DUF329 family)